MRQSKTKEIDGLTFTVMQMPGKKGTRLFFKLSRLLAPALAKVASSGFKGLGQMDMGALSEGLSLLTEKLSPDEFDAIRDELLAEAYLVQDGSQMPVLRVFDEVLAGKVSTAFKLLKFALEVNFEDFFAALPASLQAAGTPTAKSDSKG